jgi:hypothetical protein
MLSAWAIASLTLLSGPTFVCHGPGAPSGNHRSDLEALYAQGKTYVEFRDAATQRVQAWNDHYANAQVPDALQTRLTALPGSWRLLVVAEDWCGDSANTIPYVAKLVDVAGNLDLRIINSTVGRTIMESHRTPDGRAATPTVILLTDDFQEAGCWVERPRRLQDWFLSNEDKLSEKDLYDQKYAWYAEDQGQETLEDIVAMIEAAAAGDPGCAS